MYIIFSDKRSIQSLKMCCILSGGENIQYLSYFQVSKQTSKCKSYFQTKKKFVDYFFGRDKKMKLCIIFSGEDNFSSINLPYFLMRTKK